MTCDRRAFLHYCSSLAGVHVIGTRLSRTQLHRLVPQWGVATSRDIAAVMADLAEHAIDAAVAAGAEYADVRLTHTLSEWYASDRANGLGWYDELPTPLPMQDIDVGHMRGSAIGLSDGSPGGVPTVVIGIGVRALMQGYWGFASSAVWTDADAVRLGKDAVAQAAVNAAAGLSRSVDLGKIPIVKGERWVQPGIDPFTVPVDEKLDVIRSLAELPVQGHRLAMANVDLSFKREERVFASSEGASYSQIRFYCNRSKVELDLGSNQKRGGRTVQQIIKEGPHPYSTWHSKLEIIEDGRRARGWESIRDLDATDLAERLLTQAVAHRDEAAALNFKPVDVGQYDVVFGVEAAAPIIYQTLGRATELDRALGYEANASGTSYLGPDPFQYLGTMVASPHVTLLADRTTPHALATAQWDDEGMPCGTFPLIENGVLVDYQTTREQASWLGDWYARRRVPVQSHACSTAATALDFPIQMSPNFTLDPGPEALDVDDLIKDTKRGIYFPLGMVQVDQQVKNGAVIGIGGGIIWPREIRNGKLGAVLQNAGALFNASEFWKNVIAVGGQKSGSYIEAGEQKGEPDQGCQCTVRAVPIKVKDCAIVDPTRKV